MKRYNDKHDAYYDDERDVWLEKQCGDKYCEMCKNRPEKPSEAEQ